MRILIVDDHRVVRAGVRSILEDHAGFHVVGEASTASEARTETLRLHPDLVLLDMRLPDESGTTLCRELKESNPALKIAILTSFAEETLVFSALAAGADGYLLKDCHDEALLSSLSAIAGGAQVLAPAVRAIVSGAGRKDSRRSFLADFTARELGILRLLAQGATYKEAAHQLSIAEKTVRNTVSQMIEKSRANSRNELIAEFARQEPDRH